MGWSRESPSGGHGDSAALCWDQRSAACPAPASRDPNVINSQPERERNPIATGVGSWLPGPLGRGPWDRGRQRPGSPPCEVPARGQDPRGSALLTLVTGRAHAARRAPGRPRPSAAPTPQAAGRPVLQGTPIHLPGSRRVSCSVLKCHK